MSHRRSPWIALTLLACTLLACDGAPIASGLEEVQANRVVVALDKARIAAEKEADPTSEGRYRVVVGADDATRALVALRDEDLPQTRQPNMLEATSASGSLVPSVAAEHATLLAGLQGELARTLESVPGVLAARVHVNAPMHDSLTPFAPKEKASASVLIEHTGTTPPITADAVEQIVSRAVGDLETSDVAVVMIPRPASSGAPASAQLTHVLSIAVAPGSVRAVYAALAVIALVLVGFVGFTWLLVRRLRNLESSLAAASGEAS